MSVVSSLHAFCSHSGAGSGVSPMHAPSRHTALMPSVLHKISIATPPLHSMSVVSSLHAFCSHSGAGSGVLPTHAPPTQTLPCDAHDCSWTTPPTHAASVSPSRHASSAQDCASGASDAHAQHSAHISALNRQRLRFIEICLRKSARFQKTLRHARVCERKMAATNRPQSCNLIEQKVTKSNKTDLIQNPNAA